MDNGGGVNRQVTGHNATPDIVSGLGYQMILVLHSQNPCSPGRHNDIYCTPYPLMTFVRSACPLD